MNVKVLSFGLGLCMVAAGNAWPTLAVEHNHALAIETCAAAGEGAPASPVTAIADGRGGSLVWLTDTEANLFLCGSDGSGHVYTYSLIFDDLLEGAGAQLITPITIDRDGKPVQPVPDPLEMAALACQAYLDGEAGKIVGRGADGLNANWLPGYFVFLETEAGETFLCDATPNIQVWVFARIGAPPILGNPVG
jgi:hypothetical protein